MVASKDFLVVVSCLLLMLDAACSDETGHHAHHPHQDEDDRDVSFHIAGPNVGGICIDCQIKINGEDFPAQTNHKRTKIPYIQLMYNGPPTSTETSAPRVTLPLSWGNLNLTPTWGSLRLRVEGKPLNARPAQYDTPDQTSVGPPARTAFSENPIQKDQYDSQPDYLRPFSDPLEFPTSDMIKP